MYKNPNKIAILIGVLLPITALAWYAPVLVAQLAIFQPIVIDIAVETPTYEFSWERYQTALFSEDQQWIRVVSLGALLNIACFFLLLQFNKDNWALGIFYGTVLDACVIGVLKFVL